MFTEFLMYVKMIYTLTKSWMASYVDDSALNSQSVSIRRTSTVAWFPPFYKTTYIPASNAMWGFISFTFVLRFQFELVVRNCKDLYGVSEIAVGWWRLWVQIFLS